jgi:hypothetical protein
MPILPKVPQPVISEARRTQDLFSGKHEGIYYSAWHLPNKYNKMAVPGFNYCYIGREFLINKG